MRRSLACRLPLYLVLLGVASAGPFKHFAAPGSAWPLLPCRTVPSAAPARNGPAGLMGILGDRVQLWNDANKSCSGAIARVPLGLPLWSVADERVTAVTMLENMTLAVATYLPSQTSYGPSGLVYVFSASQLGMASGHDIYLETGAEILSMLQLPTGATLLGGTLFSQQAALNGTIEVFGPSDLRTGGASSFAIETKHGIAELVLVSAQILAASTGVNGEILFYETAAIERREGSVKPLAELNLQAAIHAVVIVDGRAVVAGDHGLQIYSLDDVLQNRRQEPVLMYRVDTVYVSLAVLPGGFAAGCVDFKIEVFVMSEVVQGGVRPRKELYTNGWPSPILVLDDNGLAVITGSNTVDIFDEKVLQDHAYFVRPSRALPLDTPGISMVNLPGRGLVVASMKHVSIFSHAGMSSAGKPIDELSVPRPVSFVHSISNDTVLVGQWQGAVAVFSTSSGTQPRYSSGPWFPFTRLQLDVYSSLAGATSAELLPTLDLLAIGAWPSDVYFFNLSSLHRSPSPYLEAESILRSRGPVNALASSTEFLWIGASDDLLVIDLQFFDMGFRRIRMPGEICSLAVLSDSVVAAGLSASLVIPVRTRPKHGWNFLEIKDTAGSVHALLAADGVLLAATEASTLHVFALDDMKFRELAVLSVRAVNPAVPSSSLAIIDDRTILVGLDLYRADDARSLCSPGLFSKSGQYVCHPCPIGWTSDGGSASCTYARLPILLKTWIPVALTFILIGAVLSPLAGQLYLCASRYINMGEALAKARSRAATLQSMLTWTSAHACQREPRHMALRDVRVRRWVWAYAASTHLPIAVWLATVAQQHWVLAGSILLAVVFTFQHQPVLHEDPSGELTAQHWACLSLRCLATANVLAGCSCFFFPPAVLLVHAIPLASVAVMSGNCALANEIHMFLQTSYVSVDEISAATANTAGVRVLNMGATCIHATAAGVSTLTLAQHEGHQVMTIFGLSDTSSGSLPLYLLVFACSVSFAGVALAARACDQTEAILSHATTWASDERVPPSRIPASCCCRQLLLRLSASVKTWVHKHWLLCFSSLYDTHTFYGRLRESQSTSQRPYFALILFIGAGTAMVNCLALLLDRCRMKLPELGDRNLRLSTLSKCLLVFMKLRVLQLPVVVTTQMDTFWLDGSLSELPSSVIPVWICSEPVSCPSWCTSRLNGTCTYDLPSYNGCFCSHRVAGIPDWTGRLKVLGNCVISIIVMTLLSASKMRARGIFDLPVISSRAVACATILPPFFFAVNAMYLSFPDLATQHLDSAEDFTILSIPALIYAFMANEMARHVETATKRRCLAAGSELQLSGRKVTAARPHLEHIVGTSLLSAEDSSGPVQILSNMWLEKPTYVWCQPAPHHGSVYSPSGYRALVPWANFATVTAIWRARHSLGHTIIIVNTALLLVLLSSSIWLCLTLKQGVSSTQTAASETRRLDSEMDATRTEVELQETASWQGNMPNREHGEVDRQELRAG
ncbi:MNS3 [Symbiodinium sp. CCMP2456]|nr:MNS3 [Symbiodinium sp. CCMP2456]